MNTHYNHICIPVDSLCHACISFLSPSCLSLSLFRLLLASLLSPFVSLLSPFVSLSFPRAAARARNSRKKLAQGLAQAKCAQHVRAQAKLAQGFAQGTLASKLAQAWTSKY